MMIRLVVTGRHGQVATSLVHRAGTDVAVIAVGRPQLDLENPATVETAIAAAKPDIIVNAAAYTAVDKAEQEPAKAFAINGDGAGAVARAAQKLGVPLIHLSTDYVYSGAKPAPYVETDVTGPLGVYGASKLAGEQVVRENYPGAAIFRTSWVYSPHGANFVKTMLRIGGERGIVKVVDDQTGNPTSALDLASAILRIAPRLVEGQDAAGVYHLAGQGHATWYDLARHVFEVSATLGGPRPQVHAIATADYPALARRPANSRLDTGAFERRFGFALRPWREAVAETVQILLKRSGD